MSLSAQTREYFFFILATDSLSESIIEGPFVEYLRKFL